LNDVALGDDESLDAISNASAITGNAVDVFIYDTSNDSDGGAWRKRTQATSWYNEVSAYRGSRKDFPSVAVIVTEATRVTIYDGDTPDLDMWMVLRAAYSHNFSLGYGQNGSLTATTAVNGVIYTTSTSTLQDASVNAIFAHNFISDVPYQWNSGQGFGYYPNNIAGRWAGGNLAYNNAKFDATKRTVSNFYNDIAVTVLPNAPIDSTTGLPIPTIACLVGESLVTLSNGTNKRIDEVEIGEVVKTLEGEHTVTNWFDQGVKEVIELEFDGGQRLTCTADHRIRTTDGWVEAGNLTDSDEVVGL